MLCADAPGEYKRGAESFEKIDLALMTARVAFSDQDDKNGKRSDCGLPCAAPRAIFASSSLLVAAGRAYRASSWRGSCGIVLYQSRQDALNHTRDTLRDVAPIAERDIERNFELYELSLQAVVDGIKDPEVMSLSPDLRREVLFDRAASANIWARCWSSMPGQYRPRLRQRRAAPRQFRRPANILGPPRQSGNRSVCQ